MKWLAKLCRYDGNDTILGYYKTEAEAQERVNEWNDSPFPLLAYMALS